MKGRSVGVINLLDIINNIDAILLTRNNIYYIKPVLSPETHKIKSVYKFMILLPVDL